MKKLVTILLAAVMLFALVGCAAAPILKDEAHTAWVAHGQYKLADGTDNAWGGKDSDLYEKSALTAISMDDLKAISSEVYDALSKKEVKYLYTIDLIFGTNDAGWTSDFVKDGVLYRANGSYCFKVAQCNADIDGDNKVYAEDQWLHDPKTANVESLTPVTLFFPPWQEEKDEYGLAWDNNPVVIGGAGLYTLVIAQYANASAAGTPGYGAALILKEAKEGLAYEEVKTYVPADHTYGIVGSFAASNWGENADVAMAKDGDAWKGEVELKAGEEFKVRADSDWTYSWGTADGGNLKAEEDGTYEVVLTFAGEAGSVAVNKK